VLCVAAFCSATNIALSCVLLCLLLRVSASFALRVILFRFYSIYLLIFASTKNASENRPLRCTTHHTQRQRSNPKKSPNGNDTARNRPSQLCLCPSPAACSLRQLFSSRHVQRDISPTPIKLPAGSPAAASKTSPQTKERADHGDHFTSPIPILRVAHDSVSRHAHNKKLRTSHRVIRPNSAAIPAAALQKSRGKHTRKSIVSGTTAKTSILPQNPASSPRRQQSHPQIRNSEYQNQASKKQPFHVVCVIPNSRNAATNSSPVASSISGYIGEIGSPHDRHFPQPQPSKYRYVVIRLNRVMHRTA